MKLRITHLILAGGVCLAASAFVIDNVKPKPRFIDRANMDLSVKPGDDFWQYADGGWLKNHTIPGSKTRWGAFNILAQQNIDHVVALLKETSKTPGQLKGSVKQRVGDMYASGMDSVAIEKLGYTPIKADLQRIDRIKTTDDVVAEITYQRTHALGSPMFAFGVGPDSKHPNVNIAG
ncbi:MAG TPA: hypothetical protein VNW51_01360, partial [Mucilaginibacter sp.]|nr:hypothetical protein [Mucilaginibacter sp.]